MTIFSSTSSKTRTPVACEKVVRSADGGSVIPWSEVSEERKLKRGR